MAKRFLAPTTASICTSSSAVAALGYVWVGLTAEDSAASATFYDDDSAVAGQDFWCLQTTASTSTPMVGPFDVTCGVYVNLSGTNSCAIVAFQ